MPYLAALVNSKIGLLRLRVAQYFEMILSAAVSHSTGAVLQTKAGTIDTVDQNSQIIDFFLIRATDDQNQEVRNYARFCFMLYRKLLPDKSTALLLHGIPQMHVRKQIIQEFGLDMAQLNLDMQRVEQTWRQEGAEDAQATDRPKYNQHDITSLGRASQFADKSDESFSLANTRQRHRTPLRESMQKLRSQFEDAKTPEQFIRAQKRAKSPAGRSNFSRSPFKRSPIMTVASVPHNQSYLKDLKGLEQRKQLYRDGNGAVSPPRSAKGAAVEHNFQRPLHTAHAPSSTSIGMEGDGAVKSYRLQMPTYMLQNIEKSQSQAEIMAATIDGCSGDGSKHNLSASHSKKSPFGRVVSRNYETKLAKPNATPDLDDCRTNSIHNNSEVHSSSKHLVSRAKSGAACQTPSKSAKKMPRAPVNCLQDVQSNISSIHM